jgi:hypothetical protein
MPSPGLAEPSTVRPLEVEDFAPSHVGKRRFTARLLSVRLRVNYGFVTCSEMLDSRSIVYFLSQA